MTTVDMLIYLLIFSISVFAVLSIILLILRRRSRGSFAEAQRTFKIPSGKSAWNGWLQRSYVFAVRMPIASTYILRLRKRISLLHPYHEFALRCETMKASLFALSAAVLTILLLVWLHSGITFVILALLAGIVIHHLWIDMFMYRLERKLLAQSVELFSDVRHIYQQHGMVEEAIYEAAELAKPEIAIHAERIYQALISQNPEEELDRYYETAPNRYLKTFGGISHLVMEFGDTPKRKNSIFLQGISSLTKEIQLEILRRTKLEYLLQGLYLIALAPVFFTKPIENWARSSFPAMDEFYTSKLGILTKLSIYIIIMAAYALLRKLQQNPETDYRAGFERRSWEGWLFQKKYIKQFLSLWIPGRGSPHAQKIMRLLKESSTKLQYEWFYIQRIVLGITAFIAAISVSMLLHYHAQHQILNAPAAAGTFFGKMSSKQAEESKQTAALDQETLKVLQQEFNDGYAGAEESAQAVRAVEAVYGNTLSAEQMKVVAERVISKWQMFEAEHLKWWEVLAAMAAAAAGFYFPLWTLYFNRKVRGLEMKHEVYQYQTVISILRHMERVSVENLLEWLNRFAVIFKVPIQKCLLHYEQGAELALEELREDVWFPEFQRLVDKLILAVDKVPISEVFDDLEGEMLFAFEQRRQEYERSIETKAAWGRLIGFTPMYALIFLYLVIPLIGMSFSQMGVYYEQIQRL